MIVRMNLSKKKTIGYIVSIVVIVGLLVALCFYGYQNFQTYGIIRVDKIPFLGAFFLELDKPGYIDSRGCQPLTWEDLETDNDESWLYLNPYTTKILQRHLKENNLALAPGYYPDHHLSANFEEVLETFDFIELGKTGDD